MDRGQISRALGKGIKGGQERRRQTEPERIKNSNKKEKCWEEQLEDEEREEKRGLIKE